MIIYSLCGISLYTPCAIASKKKVNFSTHQYELYTQYVQNPSSCCMPSTDAGKRATLASENDHGS